MKFNVNRLVVAVVLVVSVLLIMGAMESRPGRYQISGNDACVWLLDTETGKVWVCEKRAVEADGTWTAGKPAKWYNYGSPGESSTR